jgi:hypothetical protein
MDFFWGDTVFNLLQGAVLVCYFQTLASSVEESRDETPIHSLTRSFDQCTLNNCGGICARCCARIWVLSGATWIIPHPGKKSPKFPLKQLILWLEKKLRSRPVLWHSGLLCTLVNWTFEEIPRSRISFTHSPSGFLLIPHWIGSHSAASCWDRWVLN